MSYNRKFSHYVPVSFRLLSDEQVGFAQHRLIDLKHRVVDVAKDLKVSVATIYKARNAVPKQCLHMDEHMLARLHKKASVWKRRRKLKRVG